MHEKLKVSPPCAPLYYYIFVFLFREQRKRESLTHSCKDKCFSDIVYNFFKHKKEESKKQMLS